MARQAGQGTGVRRSGERRIRTAERRALVYELRVGGATFDQIVQVMRTHHPDKIPPSYHKGVAYQDVMWKLKQLATSRPEGDAEYRAQEDDRLDRMHQRFWTPMLSGDNDAFKKVAWVMERRAKLHGLDKLQSGNMISLQEMERRVFLVLHAVQENAYATLPPEQATAQLQALQARLTALADVIGLPGQAPPAPDPQALPPAHDDA